jgi:hypothetical protein
MAEESSERRSKQRSASGGFCLADATTDSSWATRAPNRESGMGSPPPPPPFAMGSRGCERREGGNRKRDGCSGLNRDLSAAAPSEGAAIWEWVASLDVGSVSVLRRARIDLDGANGDLGPSWARQII